MQEQIAKLKDGPDIIVATPSKLVQHLKDGAHGRVPLLLPEAFHGDSSVCSQGASCFAIRYKHL
jgi:hypothetical protein